MNTAGAARERIYTTRDSEIEAALAAASDAQLVPADAPDTKRLRAWALYGFHSWQAERMETAKREAYDEIAAEEGRGEMLDTLRRQALDAGIF